MAATTTVPDEAVAQHHPVVRVEEVGEIGFHLRRGGRVGPAESARHPHDVGVRGDPGDSEGIAEDDIGGLAAHAWQGHQGVEAFRDVAVELVNEFCGHRDQPHRSGRPESQGCHDCLDLADVSVREGLWVGPAGEQGGSDGVHPSVGRLG